MGERPYEFMTELVFEGYDISPYGIRFIFWAHVVA